MFFSNLITFKSFTLKLYCFISSTKCKATSNAKLCNVTEYINSDIAITCLFNITNHNKWLAGLRFYDAICVAGQNGSLIFICHLTCQEGNFLYVSFSFT